MRCFADDVAFLRDHVETIVLGDDPRGPRVAVVPAYQGRVMTSTASGDAAAGFGYINDAKVAEGVTPGPINVFGGEDRFWLGPEGGQFALFFPPGAPCELAHWRTPAAIDTEPYEVASRSSTSIAFRHESRVRNAAGAVFDLRIDREIRLLDTAGGVACESINRVTNLGDHAWTADTGLPSIWILGMYRHGPETTVVLPFRPGDGPVVNDEYFGKVPADRLAVGEGVVFFRADGAHRSKIGLGPARATPVCGSWDAARGALTLVEYDQPGPDVTAYVNSMWEHQDDPYGGDVVNSYNDGPPGPGLDPLGPFYELETSSPALALAPGDTAEHVHRTFHLEGDRDVLDRTSRGVLGVSLEAIESALPG